MKKFLAALILLPMFATQAQAADWKKSKVKVDGTVLTHYVMENKDNSVCGVATRKDGAVGFYVVDPDFDLGVASYTAEVNSKGKIIEAITLVNEEEDIISNEVGYRIFVEKCKVPAQKLPAKLLKKIPFAADKNIEI